MAGFFTAVAATGLRTARGVGFAVERGALPAALATRRTGLGKTALDCCTVGVTPLALLLCVTI